MADLQKRSEWYRQRGNTMDEVLGVLDAPAWSGLAADAFRQRLRVVRDAARVASTRHSEAGAASKGWAQALFTLQHKADNALEEAVQAQADLAAAQAAQAALAGDHTALLDALEALQRTYSTYANAAPPAGTPAPTGLELAAARRQAETVGDELSRAGRSVEEAQQWLDQARRDAQAAQAEYKHEEDTFVRTMGDTLSGALEHATAPDLKQYTSAVGKLTSIEKLDTATVSPLMGVLSRLTPAELKLLLAGDPSLVQQFWEHPPAPEMVAGWWNGLTPEVRTALIQAAPGIFGNLPGLPYSDRDRANRISYKEAMKDPNLTAEQRAVLDKMKRALNPPADDVPVQVVAFNLYAKPPMVAVGYGDLDACENTTWCASGMGFGAKDALDSWSDAAKNLWNTQKYRMGVGSPGVIACLEYDNPDVVGVNFRDAAKKGASRFAAELDGNAAARAVFGPGPAPITVTAHSYGTTMAACALTLTHTPVDAFVMVGSAGIDITLVPSLAAVHAGNIYTTAATGDHLAPLGSAVSGRAEPNPGVADSLNPAIGGAESFSSDGDGKDLEPVDGHNPLGTKGSSKPGGLGNAEPSEDHGYFDPNTQALFNIAATTSGQPNKVNGGLTDTGAAAAEHNRQVTENIDRLSRQTGLGR
ncbi:alpha/beta hydrolase [Leifsonia sp. 2TAF2]|uniref:alpha/beta hydrolase n=1 Tax=Leifsonia sp. 2TAF2 TaxID=3233009 RepID=UPI003F94BA99